MTLQDLNRLLVSPDDPVRAVIQSLNDTGHGIALVVGAGRRLIETITDGDVRRGVLAGCTLDDPARVLVDQKATLETVVAGGVTAPVGTDRETLTRLMADRVIQQIPLLDADGCVADVVLASDLLPPAEPSPLRAVVMAGGFGTRLRPLTEDTPKPMLPVGDRPLLERILEGLRGSGIHKVNISTHYLPEKITEHFGAGDALGMDLAYMAEDEPLGTAGALSLMDAPDEPVVVMNGDILTGVDFRAMLAFHREHGAELTVGVRQYDVAIPYGVLDCDGPLVQGLREKPTVSFPVNAGIYLLEPSVYPLIPPNTKYNMTDLIEDLIADGRTVASFPIVEYWLDIGQHDDYVQAQADYETGAVR